MLFRSIGPRICAFFSFSELYCSVRSIGLSLINQDMCLNLLMLHMPSINVTVGEKEDRMMITGMHSISDIFCVGCGEIVGWKYVRLFVMIIL